MKKYTSHRMHQIYDILLSISIILAGFCLIAGCLTIYFTDEGTYSRKIVTETFSHIAIPVYICLALTIGGFVWELLQPTKVQKSKPEKAYSMILHCLSEKKDFSQCNDAVLASINKERKSRKLHVIIRTILLVISSILFLTYALNGTNFHQSEITKSMIHAMWVLIPCTAVPLAYAIFTVYHNKNSMQREIELLKQVPAMINVVTEGTNKTSKKSVCLSKKIDNILRYALLLVGVGILVYGFISGGTIDVLTKAINICTECIGLG